MKQTEMERLLSLDEISHEDATDSNLIDILLASPERRRQFDFSWVKVGTLSELELRDREKSQLRRYFQA